MANRLALADGVSLVLLVNAVDHILLASSPAVTPVVAAVQPWPSIGRTVEIVGAD